VPATVAVTLRLYDSGGLLVFEAPAGAAGAALGGVRLSQEPWDPSQGPLILSWDAWSHSFDGLDASGAVLRNGAYLLVLESAGGGNVQAQLRVIGTGSGLVSLRAGPNPLRPGQTQLRITWSPLMALELKIYTLSGDLVRDLGRAALPPLTWDLRNASGSLVANGIYIVIARVPGERQPQFFKLMVAR
jgi:hypothetical protein